jgi:hypothetical protein
LSDTRFAVPPSLRPKLPTGGCGWVTNQFGTIDVDTGKADLLLVPAAKSEGCCVEPLEEVGVDHFKCYRVAVAAGTPAFEPRAVKLGDQFAEYDTVIVLEPTKFCNPVDKNHEGIIDANAHLLCYTLDPGSFPGTSRSFWRRWIETADQFGLLSLRTSRPRELCVPSETEERN